MYRTHDPIFVYLSFLVILVLGGCGDFDADPVGPEPLDHPAGLPEGFLLRDVGDLMALQQRGAIPRADVNRDGIVDIRDLVLVAQSFGLTVDRLETPVSFDPVEWRVIAKDDRWWTFSWRVTVTNHTDTPMYVSFDVKFFDADGFERFSDIDIIDPLKSSEVAIRTDTVPFVAVGTAEEIADARVVVRTFREIQPRP